MKRIKESYGFLVLKSMLISAIFVIVGYSDFNDLITKHGSEIPLISIFKYACIGILVYQLIAVVVMLPIHLKKYKDVPVKHFAIAVSTVIMPITLLTIMLAISNHFINVIDAGENTLIPKELEMIPAILEVAICIVASTAIWFIGMMLARRIFDVINPTLTDIYGMMASCFVMLIVQSIIVWLFYHCNTPGYPLAKRDIVSFEAGSGLMLATIILIIWWVKKQPQKEGER